MWVNYNKLQSLINFHLTHTNNAFLTFASDSEDIAPFAMHYFLIEQRSTRETASFYQFVVVQPFLKRDQLLKAEGQHFFDDLLLCYLFALESVS